MGAEPTQVLACVRCKNPMSAIDVGAGAIVHACTRCARLFVPPRAWSRAFAARDVVSDLERRLGQPPHGEVAPLGSCPVCARQMDRARFAATSPVVIDACAANHGVFIANGDLGRAVDYAAHKSRIGEHAAVREADAAWQNHQVVVPPQVLAAEAARVRASGLSQGKVYAKRSAIAFGLYVVVRVLFALARNHHAPDPKTAAAAAAAGAAAGQPQDEDHEQDQGTVDQAGAQGEAELK
jgi:hypothetical protein